MTWLNRILGRNPSTAARDLALHRVASERERIRERTRQILRELGKPVPEVLK